MLQQAVLLAYTYSTLPHPFYHNPFPGYLGRAQVFLHCGIESGKGGGQGGERHGR